MRKLWLIVAASMAGGVCVTAVADVVAQSWAEDRISGSVQCSEILGENPLVDIGGFPFLLDVARGTVSEVHIASKDRSYGRFDDVDITAHLTDVRVRGGAPEFSQGQVDVLIPYTSVEQSGLPQGKEGGKEREIDLSYMGNDQLGITSTVQALGQELPVTVVGSFELKENTATFETEHIEAMGRTLSPALLQRFRPSADLSFELPAPPRNTHYTQLSGTPDGLKAQLAITGDFQGDGTGCRTKES